MPSEQLRFWLETITSVIGLIGVFAIALELLRARRADARDFIFHISEKYKDIYNERTLVNSFEFSNMDEWIVVIRGKEEHWQAYATVFNFWDLLTKTVRATAIDRKIAITQWGRVFMLFHEKFSQVSRELIELEGGHNWYENFDWFAEEYMKYLPSDLDAMKRQNEIAERVLAEAA